MITVRVIIPIICESKIKLNFVFFVARRATQFYKARPAALCDICDGDDCGESCKVQAAKRVSERSERTETESDGVSKGKSDRISYSLSLLIVAAILKILY